MAKHSHVRRALTCPISKEIAAGIDTFRQKNSKFGHCGRSLDPHAIVICLYRVRKRNIFF